MSWLTWAKTALKVGTGGMSSVYLYGGLLAAGAALSTGAWLWHGWQVDGVHDEAFKAGKDLAKGEALAAQNRALLTQREQIITLSNDLTELRNAHAQTVLDLAAARGRAVAAGQRVRNAVPAGGELDQRIAAAECPVVRTFAAGAFRTAATCRDAVADLGLGAGGLVESTASAYHEAGRADALIRFSMPRSPFTPQEKTP
jgi:hypothetical protein